MAATEPRTTAMGMFGEAGAVYDEDERYRYRLWRKWSDGPRCLFVMLNPSTATEHQLDPTVRRCRDFARRAGYGSLEVVNLFAYRATDPDDMKAADDPVGPDNDAQILAAADAAGCVVAAWGGNGGYLDRDRTVWGLLSGRDVVCLGVTKHGGHPRHPLYVAGKTPLRTWSPPWD